LIPCNGLRRFRAAALLTTVKRFRMVSFQCSASASAGARRGLSTPPVNAPVTEATIRSISAGISISPELRATTPRLRRILGRPGQSKEWPGPRAQSVECRASPQCVVANTTHPVSPHPGQGRRPMSTQTTVAGTGCWNRTASYNACPTRSWTAPMFASMYPSLTVLLRHDFSAT
jgi:hypothetical protein